MVTHIRLATQVHPSVLAHSIHVAVDLHCSTVVALDLVVSTKGWYNGAVYQVSNVLGSLISLCFSHLIWRADGLLVADYSGREGEGDVVSLTGRGSGKRGQS